MSDTPTSETDLEAFYTDQFSSTPMVKANFARRLECERDEALEKAAHFKEACIKQSNEIEQIAGRVLGYPWFKDDQKNFPDATEDDGVCVGEHTAESIVEELAESLTKTRALCSRLEASNRELAGRLQTGYRSSKISLGV